MSSIPTLADAARLYKEGLTADAEAACAAVLLAAPRNAAALHLQGLIALRAGDVARGAGLMAQSIAIEPRDALAQSNYAAALLAQNDYEPALAAVDAALALQPGFPRARDNRAAILANWATSLRSSAVEAVRQGRLDAAGVDFAQAVALDPDHADAHISLGILALQQGDYARGWSEYEWRWKSPSLAIADRGFAAPQWTGQPLAGKTIFLHNEQGFGDAIQFCRYVPMIVALGARVILEVPAPLVSLLRQLPAIVMARGESVPDFDFHCPLVSLPHAFKTDAASIPSAPRYLKADPAKVAEWQTRLREKKAPRIGLTWSGNPEQTNDKNRSIALAKLLTALPKGFEYVSLQKDVNTADMAVLLAGLGIRHFGDVLADFSDTAALTGLMDGVVSVCTSTLHLAGALGKPTLALLCSNPCWRWLLGREDSPWYPRTTLYRQDTPGDWSPVLARTAEALRAEFFRNDMTAAPR